MKFGMEQLKSKSLSLGALLDTKTTLLSLRLTILVSWFSNFCRAIQVSPSYPNTNNMLVKIKQTQDRFKGS